MDAPSKHDKFVKVKAYLTDEEFGYEHWRATQFLAPGESRHAILVIYDSKNERDEALNKMVSR